MRSKWGPKSWAAALLSASFGLRLLLSLLSDGFSGIDAGAYLLHALSLLGSGTDGVDITRPPLAPGWLLVPFISAFGNVTGYNLFSAMFSMVLPLVVTWIAFRVLSPWRAVVLVGLVAFDPALLGMMVTGVLPLIGFSFILLASFGMWTTSDRGLNRASWLTVAALPLIAYTNQTSAGLAAIVLPLQWLLLSHKKANVAMLALGGILAITALPWYLGASPTSGRLTYPGPVVLPHNIWEYQLPLGLMVLWWARKIVKRPDLQMAPTAVRAAVWMIAFLAVFQMFQSFNEVVMNLFYRATYLMLPFVWITVAWSVRESGRSVSRRALAIAMLLVVLVAVWQVRWQQDLSGYGPDTVLATVDAIPDDAGAVVTNAQATGFIIAAVKGKDVLWTNYIAPPPAFVETDRDARCTMGWIEDCTFNEHVTHVLVDTRLPFDAVGFAPRDLLSPYGAAERRPWDELAELPWLSEVARNGPAVLYEVQPRSIASRPSGRP